MKTYTVKIDSKGTIRWYKENTDILHREDGPAIEDINGDKYWYINGGLHRKDGPAVEWANGDKEWYIDGKCLSEPAFNARKNLHTCDGKTVKIEGKRYQLKLVE